MKIFIGMQNLSQDIGMQKKPRHQDVVADWDPEQNRLMNATGISSEVSNSFKK